MSFCPLLKKECMYDGYVAFDILKKQLTEARLLTLDKKLRAEKRAFKSFRENEFAEVCKAQKILEKIKIDLDSKINLIAIQTPSVGSENSAKLVFAKEFKSVIEEIEKAVTSNEN